MSAVDINVKEKSSNSVFRQLIAVSSCFLGQITIGMSFGWVSPALVKLQAEDSPIPTSPSQGSTIASIVAVGGVIGPILYASKVDWLGRKWMAFIGASFFIISWIVLIFATQIYHVYISRILLGLAIGYTYGLNPTYIGEITDTRVRSLFGVMTSILFSTGVIFQYALGPYVDFYTLSKCSISIPVLMLVAVAWMPESPYFLVRQKKFKEASSAVMWLRNKTDEKSVQNEMEAIEKFVELSPKRPFMEVMKEVWMLSNRRAVMILTVLMIGQQFNGSASVKGYYHLILAESRIPLDPNVTVLVIEMIGFVVLIVSFFMINRIGRRTMFLLTCIGCGIGTIIIGLFFMLRSSNVLGENGSYMALVGVLWTQIFNGFAASSVPTIIASEMSTASIRSWFGGYKAVTLTVFNAINLKVFQVISYELGTQYGFWMCTVILIIVSTIVYFFMPETRGKSLQEIQDILSGNKTMSKRDNEP